MHIIWALSAINCLAQFFLEALDNHVLHLGVAPICVNCFPLFLFGTLELASFDPPPALHHQSFWDADELSGVCFSDSLSFSTPRGIQVRDFVPSIQQWLHPLFYDGLLKCEFVCYGNFSCDAPGYGAGNLLK